MRDEPLSLTSSKEKRRYLLPICALLLLGLSEAALAQSGRRPVKKEAPPPPPAAAAEARPETGGGKQKKDEDDIYNSREVDVKAKITKGGKDRPSPRASCPDNGRVIVRAVLHKSGKVTDVTLLKGLNCSYDKDAMNIVRRYEFTPAMKDGQPVSQAIRVEFEYRRIL
jgi:TonB family protein